MCTSFRSAWLRHNRDWCVSACLASDLIILRIVFETFSFPKRSFNFRICIRPIVSFSTTKRILLCKSDLIHLSNAIVVNWLSLLSVNVSNLTSLSLFQSTSAEIA
ncbi:MAG: hypothetical protein ACTS4W_00615 [Candidatus Hodgkinia cicadicola]